MHFHKKVAFITGASRGVGKCIALALAERGCDIVVAAKSEESTARLPGSIHETAAAIERLGRRALALRLDVRHDEESEAAVKRALDEMGRVDFLINNAGALHWQSMTASPMKRFDLVMGVNARGAYALTHFLLPSMIEQRYGHIIMMSPPVAAEHAGGKIAYAISKFGMTLIAHGLADEVRDKNVACNALWPATAIESYATINFGMGGPAMWRKPEILADATMKILAKEPKTFTGHALIDEDFLRQEGETDFVKYRCDPNSEPPKFGFDFKIQAGKV